MSCAGTGICHDRSRDVSAHLAIGGVLGRLVGQALPCAWLLLPTPLPDLIRRALMKVSRIWRLALIACLGILGGLYLANASWLTAPARGTPRVVAQRGVAQRYRSAKAADEEGCTARMIRPPSHSYIDNTLPSIEAAIAAGADVVEIDVRYTGDRQFVLFHDDDLACRTDGSGRISEHSVPELQALDVGYGYTADDGTSFPLRGKGVGLMPTLAEALQKHPQQRFLLQIKDGGPDVAYSLVAYLEAHQLANWERLEFFGGTAPLARIREIVPAARAWSAQAVRRCLTGYLETGWLGEVPRMCDDGMIIIPVDQAYLIWGWPNRFLGRMRTHRTQVMLIGRIDNLSTGQFSRLDTPEELAEIPAGFDGSIWTDQISVIGPAVHRRKAAN
jgi:glycerophosphoryl diester phosphodiesterase